MNIKINHEKYFSRISFTMLDLRIRVNIKIKKVR